MIGHSSWNFSDFRSVYLNACSLESCRWNNFATNAQYFDSFQQSYLSHILSQQLVVFLEDLKLFSDQQTGYSSDLRRIWYHDIKIKFKHLRNPIIVASMVVLKLP